MEASRPTPSHTLFEQREQVIALAERRHAINVRVFGSVVRGEDTAQSDIDLVVTFDQEASLFDQVGLEMDLSELIGYPVQVVLDRTVRPDSSIARDAVRL
jgi:predicted nucleotidyltransferase